MYDTVTNIQTEVLQCFTVMHSAIQSTSYCHEFSFGHNSGDATLTDLFQKPAQDRVYP